MVAARRTSGIASFAVLALLAIHVPAALGVQPSEGGLDASWDTDGLRAYHVTPAGSDVAQAVAIQPNGKTVIVGTASGGGGAICIISRLNANGSDDATFNGVGYVKLVLDDDCAFTAVAIQSDGKIVVAGSAHNSGDDQVGIVERFTPTGEQDATFGTKGVKQLSNATGSVELHALALQTDGSIVVAGDVAKPASATMYAARLTSKGKLDTGFATNGEFIKRFSNIIGANYSALAAVALAPNGRIVMAGNSADTSSIFALVCLTAGGVLDKTFGGDGLASVPFASTANATAVAITPGGDVVAAGITTPSQNEYAIAEVDGTGTPVDTFGDHGTVTQAVGDGNSSIQGMAVQRDGKIVLAGNTIAGTKPLLGVARYLPNGTPDTSFDGDGFYAPPSDASLFGNAVAIGQDGKITAVGLAIVNSDPSMIGTIRLLGDTTSPTAATVAGPPVFTLGKKVKFHLNSHDLNTGIAGFVLDRTRWGFGSTSATGPTTLSTLGHATTSLKAGKPGVNDCYTATPIDRAGNEGPAVSNICTAYPVDDRKLSASGKWRHLSGKHYYRHTALTTHSKGQRLVLKGGVYGTLALFATTCKGCGKVTVSRGSTSLGTFNLSSKHTHKRVKITIDSGDVVKSGKITITTKSAKPVTIDGVGLSLINT